MVYLPSVLEKTTKYGSYLKLVKIIVVMPAYNAVDTISDIVNRIKKINLDIIVIDDGSTDNTTQAAFQEGAFVISHSTNMGKGFSLRDGFDYALRNNYDGVIIMDADGQHDPQEIAAFLKLAQDSNADIIIGNRMLNPKDMPFVRFLANKIMSFIISYICKTKIPDTQCGFKFIKTGVLKNIKLNSSRYDIDTEILIKAGRENFKICSMPIKSIYSKHISSKIKPLKDTIIFLKLLFSSMVLKKDESKTKL